MVRIFASYQVDSSYVVSWLLKVLSELVEISMNLYIFQFTFNFEGRDLFGIIFRGKKKVKNNQPISDTTSMGCP